MQVTELVGVYNADGGVVGEVTYVIGHMLGTLNCALCDITHSPVRRKPEWNALVRDLSVPFTLLHRNEAPSDVMEAVGAQPLALVMARTAAGLSLALDHRDLELVNGSVVHFREALERSLAEHGWELP